MSTEGVCCKHNKKYEIIYKVLVVFVFFLFFFRVLGLDKDFPSFGLTFYQAKDEGTYSTMAILLYNYGSVFRADSMEIVIAPTFRANIVGNILQFISMKLLGDNYYGFRGPYVLISFGTFFLTYVTLKKIINIYKFPSNSKWIILPIMLYMVFDFSFLMSSRCVENSSIRALVTIFTLYLWIRCNYENKKKYFWLGFISITSMFFVYYSNVHLLGASFVIGGVKLLELIAKQKNNFKEYILNWLAGFTVGHIIVEIYYFTIWGTGCWTNLFSSLGSFSDRIVTSTSGDQSVLLRYLKGFLTFWSSNMFFYGIVILMLVVVALCINFLLFFKEHDENLLFILAVFLVIVAQSTLTNDWMERKAISIYPLLFVCVFLGFGLLIWKKNTVSKVLLNCIYILPILLCFPILYSMIRFRISKSYFVDFEKVDINIWWILTILQVLVLVIFFISMIFKKKCISVNTIMIGVGFAIMLNCYFSAKYVYTYEVYSEKEAMVGIGEIVGDEYVAGPYTYAYTLYNDIRPVWNAENYCIEDIENGKIRYFCDYSSGPYYVNLMNPQKDFVLVQSFERKLIAQGREFPIGIYEKLK